MEEEVRQVEEEEVEEEVEEEAVGLDEAED